MKKLITGIVAVFCLQVAFIIYNGPDQIGNLAPNTANYAKGDPVPPPYSPDVLGLLEAPQIDQDPILISDEQDTSESVRTNYAERRRVNTRVNPAGVKVVSKGPLFQPIVITIPEQKPVEFTFKTEYAAVLATPPAESYDISSAEAPRRETKSGLSKAVKKPYEWLKALGSKVKDIR
jgi:hypothetical protein